MKWLSLTVVIQFTPSDFMNKILVKYCNGSFVIQIVSIFKSFLLRVVDFRNSFRKVDCDNYNLMVPLLFLKGHFMDVYCLTKIHNSFIILTVLKNSSQIIGWCSHQNPLIKK